MKFTLNEAEVDMVVAALEEGVTWHWLPPEQARLILSQQMKKLAVRIDKDSRNQLDITPAMVAESKLQMCLPFVVSSDSYRWNWNDNHWSVNL